MNKRLRKKTLRKHGGARIHVSTISEMYAGGSSFRRDIDELKVKRDISDGKNLVTIEIDGELIFSYDSNFKGEYCMKNNIQTPF